MIFPSDVDALPRTPRPILPRVVRVTRPVLDLTRRDLVASTSGITFDVAPCWVSWRVCSFTASRYPLANFSTSLLDMPWMRARMPLTVRSEV